jgi:hypothetical protein
VEHFGTVAEIMAYACKHLKFLKKLKKCKDNKRCCKLIGESSKGEILAVCECIDNVLRGKVPLTERQKTRLKAHKDELLFLARRDVDWKKKRTHFKTQKGRGFPLIPLLAATVPLLIDLFIKK